jgi:hypothetical protein
VGQALTITDDDPLLHQGGGHSRQALWVKLSQLPVQQVETRVQPLLTAADRSAAVTKGMGGHTKGNVLECGVRPERDLCALFVCSRAVR